MSINLSKVLKYVGLAMLVLGIVITAIGIILPQPSVDVRYVSEFDQEYAQNNYDPGYTLPIIENVEEKERTPEEVHDVYTESSLNQTTTEALNRNIGSPIKFNVNSSDSEKIVGRFIFDKGDDELHVYEGERSGIYPPRLIIAGIFTLVAGGIVYRSMRVSSKLPSMVKKSEEDEDWEFVIDDEK